MDFSALIAGGPIQTVNPADLRAVWELMRETRAKFVESYASKQRGREPAIGIDVKLLARVCSPGVNVLAVWARSALLAGLLEQGLLAAWRHGTQLDDAVFNTAARFPVAAFNRFDPDLFLQQLSSRGT